MPKESFVVRTLFWLSFITLLAVAAHISYSVFTGSESVVIKATEMLGVALISYYLYKYTVGNKAQA